MDFIQVSTRSEPDEWVTNMDLCKAQKKDYLALNLLFLFGVHSTDCTPVIVRFSGTKCLKDILV